MFLCVIRPALPKPDLKAQDEDGLGLKGNQRPEIEFLLKLNLFNYSYSEMMPFMCAKNFLSNESVETVDSHFSCLSWSNKVKVAQLCPTLQPPWTIQSMRFSRPEYWSG